MTFGRGWPRLLIVSVLLLSALSGTAPVVHGAAGDFYVKTTTDAAGTCSPGSANSCTFRQALASANLAGPGSRVLFNIPTVDPNYNGATGTWTITLAANAGALAITSDNITIDGFSQRGGTSGSDTNTDGPEVFISGANVVEGEGFVITSNGNSVLAIGFINFGGTNPLVPGIEIGGDNNTIKGCYIGLNQAGNGAAGNGGPGIQLLSTADSNIIGGNNNAVDDFNLISGNGGPGIKISGGDANKIRGNYIGTDITGGVGVANGSHGIYIDSGSDTNVVGPDFGEQDGNYRNVIAGNSGDGVRVRNSAANRIFGNRIGFSKDKLVAIPNTEDGIQVLGRLANSTDDNLVGTSGDGFGNVVVGNGRYGIYVSGQYAVGTLVRNNYVGLNPDGVLLTGSPAKQSAGVLVDQGAFQTVIGGGSGEGNVIAGIGGDAIRITGDPSPAVLASTESTTVSGNTIGRSPITGTAFGNSGAGVLLGPWASYATIGGADAGQRNQIVRSGNYGIILASSQLSNTQILGNDVISSTLTGIQINGATVNTIDGATVYASGLAGISGSEILTSTLANVTTTGNGGSGIIITDTNQVGNLTINTATASNNGGVGVLITGGNGSTWSNVTANDNSNSGIIAIGIKGLTINTFTANANNGTGLLLMGSDGTTLTTATASGNNGSGILSPGINGLTITTVTANTNNGTGIQFTGGKDIILSTATVTNNNGSGIIATDVHGLTVTTATANNNTGNGINLVGGNDITLYKPSIQNNTSDGIRASDTFTLTISGQDGNNLAPISGNLGAGVALSTTTNTIISLIDTAPANLGNTTDGVAITNASNLEVSYNKLTHNGGAGVRVVGGDNVSIIGEFLDFRQTVTDNAVGGIQLTNITHGTVSYNNASNNTGDGIVIQGTPGNQSSQIAAFGNVGSSNTGAGARLTRVNDIRLEGLSDGTSQFSTNGQEGVLLSEVVSGTVKFALITNNQQDGVLAQNGTQSVLVTRNFIQSNGPQNAPSGTCTAFSPGSADPRSVAGQGVAIRNGSGLTQGIQVIRNRFGQNCGLAILREPNGSSAGDANNGIQAPFNFAVRTNGSETAVISGNVIASGAGACPLCVVELYETNSSLAPDGEGYRKLNLPTDYVVDFGADGSFSFLLNRMPRQIVATATDDNGNTSEFSSFTLTRTLAFARNLSNVAYPTQSISYVHTITNTGTVGDSFNLTSDTPPSGWTIGIQPNSPVFLAAGASKSVTVTVTLPASPASSVRAGIVQQTRITATSAYTSAITMSVVDTTTVLPRVVIAATPLTNVGEVRATETITYVHTITNNGNVDASIKVSASSVPNWPTSLSATDLILAPGQSTTVSVFVSPPNGTQQGATAVTTVNVVVTGQASENKTFTETTSVVTTPRAAMIPNNNGDGVQGKTTTYIHSITNLSNGTARFKLTASSSLGSSVTFVSATPGITIDSQNIFTLGTSVGSNVLNLEARVLLPVRATTDAVDIVTIQLLDAETGKVLASVQDRTTVTSGSTVLYLPLVTL